MENKISVSILGATGFTGLELVKILLRHTGVHINSLYSNSHAGSDIAEVSPQLKSSISMQLKQLSPDDIPDSDVVFLALPHTKSMEYVCRLRKTGRLIIDLSADYRFSDPDSYEFWYGTRHCDAQGLSEAVYAIPEINRADISGARLIANPGCYATSVIMPLLPILKAGLIGEGDPVFVDSKSGISGAGKKVQRTYLFSERYENLTPYSVNSHRHMGEIKEFLDRSTGKDAGSIFFCPHLVPMYRGIVTNIYSRVKKDLKEDAVRDVLEEAYGGETFVNLLPAGAFPQSKDVAGTNDCAIGLKYVPGTGDLVVISAIDNLVRGASGQAVQNMNIALGLNQTEGLV